jgi:basic membrane protein A
VAEDKATILTSAMKRVDTSIYQTIKAVVNGSFKGGYQMFDLKSEGVGYAENEFNKAMLADIKAKLDEYKAQIVAGTIKVPSTQADLDAYTAGLK